MNFYSILMDCYQKNINPFVLYSMMNDICKSDLKLKKEVGYFYEIHKQRDIVEDILRCSKYDFSVLLNQYDKKYSNVLAAIARFRHPDWEIDYKSTSVDNKNVKINKTVLSNTVISQKNPICKQQFVPIKVCKPKKQPINIVAKKRNIKVSSLLSDVEIVTTCSVVNFEIRFLQNGKWILQNGGVLKRKLCVYLNVENVEADKIKIYIPKDRYGRFDISKAHGKLIFSDKENCFDEVCINMSSGEVHCCSSAESIFINALASKVYLEYISMKNGKVDIRNALGGVKANLFFVRKINGKTFSLYGRVKNNHKGLAGNEVNLNIKSKYGDIDIL